MDFASDRSPGDRQSLILALRLRSRDDSESRFVAAVLGELLPEQHGQFVVTHYHQGCQPLSSACATAPGARRQGGCFAVRPNRGSVPIDLLTWLRAQVADYRFDVVALYRDQDHPALWPLEAMGPDDLRRKLGETDHFLPLPKEPAALANIVEVSLVDFLVERAEETADVKATRGTERGYPDLEFSGAALAGYFAVDIKVAQRRIPKRGVPTRTQSAITLYTGNTYFLYPDLHWPGTFRPFADYVQHLDVIVIYTLDTTILSRVTDVEIIVQEPWRIASKSRSSTTREYLGAVNDLERLRNGEGEFATQEAFYAFWRKHPWKIGQAVKQQLDKLIAESKRSQEARP